jgi:phthalate 4,5-dioxygenase oxygenase subunit
MLTHEQNELLCRVAGDAPMGALMRRYWLPLCQSSEVATADGPPVRARLLDEDIVVFRDSNGRVGALDEYCPHRGVSLVLARNEQCGLRCLYHGWKYDVDGNIVEMPTEPPESRMTEHLKHRAYPVRESGGLIWAYLGPAEAMPEFQPPPWAACGPRRIVTSRLVVEANWAQALEGQIDSAHSSMLHSTDIPAGRSERTTIDANGVHVRPSGDPNPRLIVKRVPYGMRYVAVRKPTTNAETHDYMRVTVFVAPCFALIPPNSRNYLCNMAVPRDDGTTNMYFVHFSETVDLDEAKIQANLGTRPGVDFDPVTGKKARNRENNFLQDREAMAKGNFSGIRGIGQQDVAMWESMGRGPIIDRSREHLGRTDVAVLQFRRIMLDAVEAFGKARVVLGQQAPVIPFAKVRSYEGIVAKGTDWESLGLCEEERGLPKDAVAAE